MYFVLAAVGLFTLIVGASVRLAPASRPGDAAFLLALRRVLRRRSRFSFNGPFDRLDWIFYWGDVDRDGAAAAAAAAFHDRVSGAAGTRAERRRRPPHRLAAAADLRAGAGARRGARRSRSRARDAGRCQAAVLARARVCSIVPSRLYLFVCAVAALVVCSCARSRTSPRSRRDGSCAGSPGAPRSAPGRLRSSTRCRGRSASIRRSRLQLTAVPLGLVPLTFASAIVRYRLRDVEVIVKRGLAYTAFLAASIALYFALLKLTAFLVRQRRRPAQLDHRVAGHASSSCCWRSR